NEVVGVKLFHQPGNPPRPGGRAVEFVTRFPTEDRRVVAIGDAGASVDASEDVPHRFFEIRDHLLVSPKIVRPHPAKRGVLGAAALPLPVVHQRDDEAYALLAGQFNGKIKCAESLLIEIAGTADVYAVAHVGTFPSDDKTVGQLG